MKLFVCSGSNTTCTIQRQKSMIHCVNNLPSKPMLQNSQVHDECDRYVRRRYRTYGTQNFLLSGFSLLLKACAICF
ncbi:hypothetical protein [Nostoc sp.]|uniref:hypothetical protein n=1 Tax=Nostoc sp. TaxID=1180 RepID=UPI002FF7666B